jgi:hypothetical protein
MIAVGAADRRILPTPAFSYSRANVKISPTPTLVLPRVPVPPLFLAVYFCFVFENLLQYEPAFSIAIHTSILYSYRSTPSSL